MGELPRSSGESTSKERDALQDILRWTIGRLAKLTDVVGELSNYLSTVGEMEATSKQRMEDMMKKIQEMANAVVGLGSSHRYVADETAKNHRTELKHLENLAWQVGGSGKGVNTSLKETVTGLGRVLGQIDGQLTRHSKSMEESNKHMAAAVENLVEIKTGIQALIQKATFSGSGGTHDSNSSCESCAQVPTATSSSSCGPCGTYGACAAEEYADPTHGWACSAGSQCVRVSPIKRTSNSRWSLRIWCGIRFDWASMGKGL